MTPETLLQCWDYIPITGIFLGGFAIFIGTISPLFSPTGKRSGHWIELGVELIKISITAYGLFFILISILEEVIGA